MSITDKTSYTAPAVTDLGTLSDVTLARINTISKTGVSGDVIVTNGQSTPVPGSSLA